MNGWMFKHSMRRLQDAHRRGFHTGIVLVRVTERRTMLKRPSNATRYPTQFMT
eukprot:m.56289 g.56289  ORF g.56289 m.56289 type:complete len:53 (-) comp11550_c0_seq1:531-689(-)